MSLTKEDKKLLNELTTKGQVIIVDKKELDKLKKKLEEVFGISELYENNTA